MTTSYLIGAGSTASSATVTSSVTTSTSAGDVIVVNAWTANAVTGVTDTQGNSYVEVNSIFGSSQWVSVGKTKALVSGTDNIIVSQASAGAGNVVSIGVPTAIYAPVDAIASASGSGTSASQSTGNLITADGQIAVAMVASAASTPAWATGWTGLGSSHGSSTEFLGAAVQEGITSSAVASATVTSGSWNLLVITLQQTSFTGSPPNPPTQRAGKVATSSDMNQLAQTALYLRRPPMVLAQTSTSGTGQSIGTSAGAVTWSMATRDTDGLFSQSHPTRLTVQTPGFYKVLYSIPFPSGSGYCQVWPRITTGGNNPAGSGVGSSWWYAWASCANSIDGYVNGGGVIPLYLYPDDYIEILAQVSTAGNMPVSPQPGLVSMRMVSV